MRKWLYVFLVISSLCIVSLYIFVPNQIFISTADEVESSDRIVGEYLNSSSNRIRWWPSDLPKSTGDSSVLNYSGYNFRFTKANFNSSEILITDNYSTANSVITWELSQKKFLAVYWKVSIPSSSNPVKRLIQYARAHQLKSHMTTVLESLLGFIIKSKNIYGIDIQRSFIKDTIVVASVIKSKGYPATPEIYKRIQLIKEYIGRQEAQPSNSPMLNIYKNEFGQYQTTIAIPVNKAVAPGRGLLINRMVAGNILVAEIKGGPQTIRRGFEQMELYVKDFKLVAPAMPFESLVTDRLAEPDTSKWITKLYYPVF